MQHLLFFSALSWIQLQIFKNFNLDGHLDNIFCIHYFHKFRRNLQQWSKNLSMSSYCSSSSWCEVLYYTLYMIVWSRISGRIIVFFVWTWVIPAWGTEGCCKPAELYFVISFYSGSGICEECSSGLHILSFYVGHSDQSLISSEYRIFGHIFLLSWHSWYEVILMMLGYGTC